MLQDWLGWTGLWEVLSNHIELNLKYSNLIGLNLKVVQSNPVQFCKTNGLLGYSFWWQFESKWVLKHLASCIKAS